MVRDLWPADIAKLPPFDVKMICDNAASAIAKLPSEAWANWVTYMLEKLDATDDPKATLTKDDILRRVQDTIKDRLYGGRW